MIISKNWNKITPRLSKPDIVVTTDLFKNEHHKSFHFEKTRFENSTIDINKSHLETLNHSIIKNSSPSTILSPKKKNDNLLDSESDIDSDDSSSSERNESNHNFRCNDINICYSNKIFKKKATTVDCSIKKHIKF